MAESRPGSSTRSARAAPRRETVWLFGLHAVRRRAAQPPARAAAPRRHAATRPTGWATRWRPAAWSRRSPTRGGSRRRSTRVGPPGRGAGGAPARLGAARRGLRAGPGPGPGRRAPRPGDRPAQRRRHPALGRGVRRPRRGRRRAPRAPETGALAKAASGALERQPYLRVGTSPTRWRSCAGWAPRSWASTARRRWTLGSPGRRGGPLALVLGAEGPGLRERTRDACDAMLRIPAAGRVRLAQRVERRGGRALRCVAARVGRVMLARCARRRNGGSPSCGGAGTRGRTGTFCRAEIRSRRCIAELSWD